MPHEWRNERPPLSRSGATPGRRRLFGFASSLNIPSDVTKAEWPTASRLRALDFNLYRSSGHGVIISFNLVCHRTDLLYFLSNIV